MSLILIVDDLEENIYMLEALLHGYGYQVKSVHNGVEALDAARRQTPDLVITDILMPGMDGFSLCREWMADETLRHVPLVFYTATYTDPQDEAFALSLGAARFIIKPTEPDAFIEIIRQVLEDHTAQRLSPPPEVDQPVEVYYQQYSQALIRKLEAKMEQLEAANRVLERDIAERIRAEEALRESEAQLRKLNRAYTMLSSSNQAIVRLREPQAIFDWVCRLAVEIGGLRMAWIGLIDNLSQPLRLVAHAGGDETYVKQASITLQGDCVKDCPIQHALHRGQHAVCNILAHDAPCREIAFTLGVRSLAAFPLQVLDQVRGVIGFCASETGFFDQHEIDLLAEMAMDLSLAMEFAEKDAALQAYSERLEEMVQDRTYELEEAHTQLVRQERLAVLGLLAGGVGHELRNPLSAIKNAAYLLRLILEHPDAETREALQILEEEVDTAERTISNLLDYARVRSPVRREVNVNDVVRKVMSRTDLSGLPRVEAVLELDEGLPSIAADSDQLCCVVDNLVRNGVQAMVEGGRLTVRTAAEGPEWIRLTVVDEGEGIPEENMGKLFEPLFTTKAKGIGLGLALVKTMVEAHGGSITVESRMGEGSTFTISLPLAEGDE